MSTTPVEIHPGMRTWRNERGVCVLQLHYDADPMKAGLPECEDPNVLAVLRDKGKDVKWNSRTKIEAIEKQKPNGLTPWALMQYLNSPSPTMYLQELEIEFEATLGEKLYFLDPAATLEKSFPIPQGWTRWMILDPHPGVPHFALWGATDPYNDRWIYREFWPSKIYGKKGNIPEDDNRVTPRDFCEVVKYLESDENPENSIKGKAFNERIFERIIDYAARGFGHSANDEQNQSNYQQRFEAALLEFKCSNPYFIDCVKNGEAGFDAVNEWLKPRMVDTGNGWTPKSRLHIFVDRCPELILELNSNRKQKLTALQADKQDPTGKPIEKRNHGTDCLKYWIARNPQYVAPPVAQNNWEPTHEGIAY